MKLIRLEISGMTCPTCSAAVNKLVDQLDGIQSREVNHVTDDAQIEYDERVISEKEIIAKINEGHYKVTGHEDIINEIDIPNCPACSKKGALVPNTVFRSNINTEHFNRIDMSVEHFICLNPDCNIAYYNEGLSIDKSLLKRELWYKKGTKRKIICYCNNIDREQIKDAVQQHNLLTWEEITSHYRKKVIEKCDRLHPTGYCCRNTFNKVVNKFVHEK